MIRTLKLALILTILASVVLYFTLPIILNKGIKVGVESVGPKITQTEVRLDKVDISPFNGKGSLHGFLVGNPEGFTPDRTFFLNEITLDIDPSTLFSDRILINRIYIHTPEIVFEQKLGGNNLNKLMANINQAVEKDKGDAPEPTTKPEPVKVEKQPLKIEITELTIEEGSVSVILIGQKITVPLPKIQVNGIGKDKGGVTPEQAVQEILKVVIKQVTESAGKAGDSAVEKVMEGTKEATGEALKNIKDLF